MGGSLDRLYSFLWDKKRPKLKLTPGFLESTIQSCFEKTKLCTYEYIYIYIIIFIYFLLYNLLKKDEKLMPPVEQEVSFAVVGSFLKSLKSLQF